MNEQHGIRRKDDDTVVVDGVEISARRFMRGLEPSGETIAVCSVFWRDVVGRWRFTSWPAEQEGAAEASAEFAKLHKTYVVASRVAVPRFAVHGW
jgi:hypothetical protein